MSIYLKEKPQKYPMVTLFNWGRIIKNYIQYKFSSTRRSPETKYIKILYNNIINCFHKSRRNVHNYNHLCTEVIGVLGLPITFFVLTCTRLVNYLNISIFVLFLIHKLSIFNKYAFTRPLKYTILTKAI